MTLIKHVIQNINTCDNGCRKFSENLRVVTLKLLEWPQFASPIINQFILISYWFRIVLVVRCDIDTSILTARAQSIYREVYEPTNRDVVYIAFATIVILNNTLICLHTSSWINYKLKYLHNHFHLYTSETILI